MKKENSGGELFEKKDALSARIDLHKKYSVNKYGWYNWVFDQFALKKNMKVLELGSGTGDLWIGRQDKIPEGAAITLTDISPLISREAGETIEGSARFSFQLIDFRNIPFDDNEFDMVIANRILYQARDLSKTLSEVKRVLKNEGVLYSPTASKKSFKELNGMYRRYDDKAQFTYFKNSPFTLENGKNVLGAWFETIEKRRYHDSLEVTRPEDLMDFITSYNDLPEDVYREMHEIINQEIVKNGAFKIRKEQGMFVSKKLKQ